MFPQFPREYPKLWPDELTDVSGAAGLRSRILNTQRANLIAYWPLQETTGTAIADISGEANNGTYSNVTLGQAGPSGTLANSYNGTTSYGDVYSAGFNSDFPTGASQALTVILYAKVPAAVWTDGAARRLYLFRVDASNLITATKSSANNRLDMNFVAQGQAGKSRQKTYSGTGWFFIAQTVSGPSASDEYKVYFAEDGGTVTQEGATFSTLGTWTGNLSSTTTNLGAGDQAGANVHSGFLAHVAVWDKVLTLAELRKIVSG